MSNVFIITRLGQLRNVHTLIEQESLQHNVLVIMYTVRDKGLLLNLQSAYREDLFEDVLYLELPAFPLRPGRKRSEKIYTAMEEVLKTVHDDHAAKELYICNIDNYYVYLERIIADHGYSMAINLFEEGLTTYKITSGESLQKKEDPPNKSDVRKAWNGFKKALKKFVFNTGILFLQCLGFIIRKPMVSCAYKLWSRIAVDKKHRFGIIRDLNKAYVCFPEMVSTDELNFKSVEKLNFKFNKVEDEELRKTLKGYSAIFINQKYVNYESHFRVLFQIFDEMGIDKVLIKLHPREDVAIVENEIRKMQQEYEDIDIKILSSIGQIPAEDLVYSYGIKTVIGLTTSSLIYLNGALEDVKVISIADRYRQLCDEEGGVASRELVQFDDEYRFFKKFEGIVQFDPEKSSGSVKEIPGQGAQL